MTSDPGIVTRYEGNPVIMAADTNGGAVKVYNPGGNGKFTIYRTVDGDDCSRLFQAESRDGGRTWQNHRPFPLQPDLRDPKQRKGFEDCRLVFVRGLNLWVACFGVYSGTPNFEVTLWFATSPDLENWTHRGSMPMFDIIEHGGYQIDWTDNGPTRVNHNPLGGANNRSKSGGAVDEVLLIEVDGRVQERLGFYFGEGGIWFAHCNLEFGDWRFSELLIDEPFHIVEGGPPSIRRPWGRLNFGHHITPGSRYEVFMYTTGLVKPDRITWHSDPGQPIMVPCTEYEVRPEAIDVLPGARELRVAGDAEGLRALFAEAIKKGTMPAVTFVSACWVDVDDFGVEWLYFMYGAQDENICLGRARMSDVEALIPEAVRAM